MELEIKTAKRVAYTVLAAGDGYIYGHQVRIVAYGAWLENRGLDVALPDCILVAKPQPEESVERVALHVTASRFYCE